MNDLNRTLFLALNGSAESARPLVLLAIFIAKYLIAVVPLHMVVVWIGGDRRMRFAALTAFAALVIAVLVNQIIGYVAFTPRPFMIGLGHQLIEHRASSSMPSNHATIFFTYGVTLLLLGLRGLAWTAVGLGLCVAWSRIYLGIHFPGDMLAAAATSTASALLAVWIMARHGKPLLERAESLYGRVTGRVTAALRRKIR